MGVLIGEFGLTSTSAGWLMSLFSIMGIVMAFPAHGLMTKLGAKLSGCFTLLFAIVGCVMGAFANSAAMLMISRVVEGIGVGLVGVTAPVVVSMWFPPEKRSLPMGIWTNYVPAGMLIMFTLANPISSGFGWRGCWRFCAIICAVTLVLYAIFVGVPGGAKKDEGHGGHGGPPPVSPWAALKQPAVWMVGLAFFVYNINSQGFYGWISTYFTEVAGIELATANNLTSIMGVFGIVSAVSVAFLSRKVNIKKLLVIDGIIYAVVIFFAFRVNSAVALIYVIILGLINGMLPAIMTMMAPETVEHPVQIGIAMAIVTGVMGNLGQAIASPLFGAIIDSGISWGGIPYLQVGLAIVTWIFALLIKLPSHKNTLKG